MRIQTSFNANIQPQFRTEIAGYLKKLEWLMPNWLQQIHVNLWNGEDPTQMISIKVNYEYREACMDVYAGWLNQTDVDKLRQMTHEVLHIHLSLLADYARDKINLLCPQEEAPKFNLSLQDELRIRHESATQDLTDAVIGRFYPNN